MCMGLCIFPSAAETVEVSAESKLYALGILDSQSNDLSRPVTRLEMVDYAVKLYGKISHTNGKTPFLDVEADNAKSGAVNFACSAGIISEGTMFYPDRTVKFEEALKMLVTALDYGEYAKRLAPYPEGYVYAASKIELLKNIEAKAGEGITLKTAVTLLDNALSCRLYDEFGVLYGSGESVLNKRFGISKYKAFINDVKSGKNLLDVEIISREKDDVKAHYNAGDNVSLTLTEKSAIGDYKYTYADIYVNEDNEVLFAQIDKDIKIEIGHLYEINKKHGNASVYPSYIDSIAFETSEDYIEVASDCVMEFNGKAVSANKAYPYMNAFARAVMYKDEVIALEAWELSEGGLITTVGDSEIKYTRGERVNTTISGIDSYENMTIFVNGLKSESWALVSGTVFDWYSSGDKENLLIVASTREITDTFDSFSSDEITIGGDVYPLSEKYDVYYSVDGTKYSKTPDLQALSSRTVTAYVDFAGYVRYVRPVLDDETSKDMYCVALGYQIDRRGDMELLTYAMDDGVAEEKVYTIKERFLEKNALVINGLKDNIDSFSAAFADPTDSKNIDLANAKIVYKIKVNSNDQIISLKPAEKFSNSYIQSTYYDKGKEGYTVDAFPGGTAQTNNPKVYFGSADIYALYYTEENGIVLNTVEWQSLGGCLSDSNVYITPYAEGGTSDIDIVLFRGDLEKVRCRTDAYYTKRGLCTEVTKGYDFENDKSVTNVVINGQKYIASAFNDGMESKFAAVDDKAYILYSDKNPFIEKNGIRMMEVYNLSGSPDTWIAEETPSSPSSLNTMSFCRGEVVKLDSRRIYFLNGDTWYIGDSVPVYEVVESNGKVNLVISKKGDIPEGSDAWYVFYNGEIETLFFRR